MTNTVLRDAAWLLTCVYFLSCYAHGLNVSLSLLVSNSSVLQTVQSARLIDEALQLEDKEGIYTITRNKEFDSMCDPSLAQREIKSTSSQQMSLRVLMDGSCSTVAEDISTYTTDNELIMMVFSSTSASINNDTEIMKTFRTVPSDRALPSSLNSLMVYFNWTRFSLVTDDNKSQHSELKRLINQELEPSTTVEEVDLASTVVNSAIQSLFDHESHLYFLNTDIQTGVKFLCEGIEELRYYPNYLWILPSWWYQVGVATQWWDDPSLLVETKCSGLNDLHTVLNRSMILRPVPVNPSSNEDMKFNTSSIDVVAGQYSSDNYAVDTTLSLLLALNETGPSTSLSQLLSALRNVRFQGVTGIVSFDSSGDRAEVMTLFQQIVFSNDTLSVVDIAYSKNGSNLNLLVSDIDDIFPDGVPPDGTPVKSIKTVELGITIFVAILSVISLTLAIVCLLFNIIFREKKIVKLTSPKLNYFLLAGVIILASGMIFYAIGTESLNALIYICLLRRLLVSIGHDIGFTVALVKTWRIYYIFKNPSPTKKAPKDWQLLIAALLIVSINAGLCIILLIFDAFYNKVAFVEDREYSPTVMDNGVREEFCAPSCGTTIFYLVFLGVTMAFKFTIHLVAVILSFAIRKIVVDTLNDFKFTSVIVYTSSILIVILVAVLVSTVNFVNLYGALVTFLVFLEVLVFLVFSFVPKMIALYKDPHGLHVMDKPSQGQEVSDIGGSMHRNASLSYYNNNRKGSSIKDEEDSGKHTHDSKDYGSNIPKIPEEDEEKVEDSVFIEDLETGEKESNGIPPANKVENKKPPQNETDV